MYKTNSKERITVRLTPSQMQVLRELKDALGVSYSMLTRTIILYFLKKNDDLLQDIIDGKVKIDLDGITDLDED